MDRGFVSDWRRRSQSSSFNTDRGKEDLFLLYCDLVERGDIDPASTDSMDVVDNFYVNGDFVRREDVDPREWRRACSRSIVHDSELALMRF